MGVGPAEVGTATGVLQEPLGDALLVGVDVEGIAQDTAVGSDEEASSGAGVDESVIVLAVELGEEADFDVSAEFGAVTADTLPEKDGFEGCAGDAGGLGLDVCADEQEGRAVGLAGDCDEDDGALGVGACCRFIVTDAVVSVVLAAAANLVEKIVDVGGVDGLIDEGRELSLDSLGDTVVGRLDADAEDAASGGGPECCSLSDVCLPLLIGDSVFEELGFVLFGGVVASLG